MPEGEPGGPGGVDERGDRALTVEEVAARLRVTRDTVRRWLRAGKLRGRFVGGRAGYRIPADEVGRFLAAPGEDQRGGGARPALRRCPEGEAVDSL